MQGTNLQHALHLAGRHLRRHPDGEPVVLVVTDGEPTAHLDGGYPFFSWPPTRETVEATVDEVDALTRYGAAINVFMLGEDAGLRRFVDAVAPAQRRPGASPPTSSGSASTSSTTTCGHAGGAAADRPSCARTGDGRSRCVIAGGRLRLP